MCSHIFPTGFRGFFSEKALPIELLRPNLQAKNDPMVIISLSGFHQKVRFDCVFPMEIPLFHENPLFHFTPYKNHLQRTLCSDFRSQLLFLFYENRPAKTQFQIGPFSTNARPEKSRTPPDRSATPYYVESFRFQPGFIERKLKILKVLSKALS